MITDDEYEKLRAELPSLRRVTVNSQLGDIPASIHRLDELVRTADTRDDRAALYPLLLSECSKTRRDDLALRFLRQQVEDLADDPLSMASLGYALAAKTNRRGEAIRAATGALELAKNQNRQVRYCATNLARVALLIDDYDALNSALHHLIENAHVNRAEDTRLEFDFLGQIDASRCRGELLARYRKLAPRDGKS